MSTFADNTYAIATWDHEIDGWHAEARGLKLWELRPWIRKLREHWDYVSISIICEQRWTWDTDQVLFQQ